MLLFTYHLNTTEGLSPIQQPSAEPCIRLRAAMTVKGPARNSVLLRSVFPTENHCKASSHSSRLGTVTRRYGSTNPDEEPNDRTDDGWNSDGDDAGWASKEKNDNDQTSTLESLQAERQQIRDKITPSTVSKEGADRDLFIPIFALVSLAGLFGAYGYEMLRLASRGELYLPWQK